MSHSRPNRRGSDRKNGLRHSRSQSIVFRLLWAFEFVDFSKNSVVPLSNEFDSQTIVIQSYFFTIDALLTAENAIFVVFGFAKGRQRLTFCIEGLRQGATLSSRKRAS